MYRHLATQEEIDREYNPRLGVPDVDALMAAWTERSAHARQRLAGRIGLRYGPTLAEHLDVFPAANDRAPVHVFLHGGYWRAFSSTDFSFIAEAAVARGHAAVIVNYALCPAVTITEIVRQARAAVAWVWSNATSFGGDRERITLSGHSAGGHLAARVIATRWQRDYGIADDAVKGAVAISGLFDLEPLRWSWLQPTLQLSGDEILAQSPIRHLPPVRIPMVAAVGGSESAEFRRQSREYAAALEAHAGRLPASRTSSGAEYLEVGGRHHFDILDDLGHPDGVLWRRVESLTGA